MKIIFVLGNRFVLLSNYSHSLTWPLQDFDHTNSERVLRNQLTDDDSRIACMKILWNSAKIIVKSSQYFWMLFVSIKPNNQF